MYWLKNDVAQVINYTVSLNGAMHLCCFKLISEHVSSCSPKSLLECNCILFVMDPSFSPCAHLGHNSKLLHV
jgi:hypothetical protein